MSNIDIILSLPSIATVITISTTIINNYVHIYTTIVIIMCIFTIVIVVVTIVTAKHRQFVDNTITNVTNLYSYTTNVLPSLYTSIPLTIVVLIIIVTTTNTSNLQVMQLQNAHFLC